MQFDTPQAVVPLSAQLPLRLTDARGIRLRSMAGTLWVTIDGDPRDQILQTGESLVVDSTQPVLVSALGGTASVGVCAPAPAASPWAELWARWGWRPTSAAGRGWPAAA